MNAKYTQNAHTTIITITITTDKHSARATSDELRMQEDIQNIENEQKMKTVWRQTKAIAAAASSRRRRREKIR